MVVSASSPIPPKSPEVTGEMTRAGGAALGGNGGVDVGGVGAAKTESVGVAAAIGGGGAVGADSDSRRGASANDAPKKRVILVSPRGYCAGVDRAVATVERALEIHGPGVYVRKEIVHNKHVVADLRARGAIFVDDIDQVPPGRVVVFSAHGVSPAVRQAARQRDLTVIDATCPLVNKVHKEAKRLASTDSKILLIGHAGHEEVEGTFGEAPESIQLVEHPDEVDQVVIGEGAHAAAPRVAWLSQTTLSVDETHEIVARLRQRFPDLIDPPSDDICYATQNRQSAVRQIARECDCMIVVGSANSSNSQRLVEVALAAGAAAAHLIDDVTQIDQTWLDQAMTVGVTSGASVPEHLVHDVVAYLQASGFSDVIEHHSIAETLTFSLPPQVR